MSRYQKGETNLDFTEASNSEWQWHQLGHVQVCTSLQTDNHASTPPLSFLQAGCPSCRPTNSVKALKAYLVYTVCIIKRVWIFISLVTSSSLTTQLTTHRSSSWRTTVQNNLANSCITTHTHTFVAASTFVLIRI